MEAKDTVMGKVQRDNIFYHGIGTLEGVCTMQAEISFKAGQESEVAHSADLCAAYWDAIKEEGHKAGIKEVVDWIQNHGGCLDGSRNEWHAFLKERGI